ncbi:MAG: DUF3298 and DUF4163 domain-containing protein, partial [bacterium]|nr:DUF3298 and DUF4163 domain-containing protein [bacterium]
VRKEDSNEEANFEIELSYPQLSGTHPEIQEAINDGINKFITDIRIDFEQNAFELGLTPDMGVPEEVKSQLFLTYANTLLSERVLSFSFDVYTYIAGAAHPFPLRRGLSFDLESGGQLFFSDLFKEDSNYLEFISVKSIERLNEKLNPENEETSTEWIESGAGPKSENYEEFYLSPDGLTIVFNVYQVTAYALGTQEILLSYEELSPVLKEEFQVQKVLER